MVTPLNFFNPENHSTILLPYQQSIILAVVALVTKWISSTNWNSIKNSSLDQDGF